MSRNRIIISVLLIVLILIGPYWIYLPLLAVAAFLFPLYWEGIIFGFLIDVFYGLGDYQVLIMRFPVAMAVTAIILLVPLARKYLRFDA